MLNCITLQRASAKNWQRNVTFSNFKGIPPKTHFLNISLRFSRKMTFFLIFMELSRKNTAFHNFPIKYSRKMQFSPIFHEMFGNFRIKCHFSTQISRESHLSTPPHEVNAKSATFFNGEVVCKIQPLLDGNGNFSQYPMKYSRKVSFSTIPDEIFAKSGIFYIFHEIFAKYAHFHNILDEIFAKKRYFLPSPMEIILKIAIFLNFNKSNEVAMEIITRSNRYILHRHNNLSISFETCV